MLTIMSFLGLSSIGILNERDTVLQKAALFDTSDNPCVHFTSNMLNIIILPKDRLVMVSPKLVSKNLGMIAAEETFEIAECVGKKIRRNRHSAVGVRFGRIENWPFTLSKNILTVMNEQAVCVQHALEEFDGTLDCNSV